MKIKKKILFSPVTFGGSTKPKSKYYEFREEIRKKFKNKKRIEEKKVSLKIRLYILKKRVRPDWNDLDNFLKPIIDGLCDFKDKWSKKTKKGVIKNETQVYFISIERIEVGLSKEEGVEIEIKEGKPYR